MIHIWQGYVCPVLLVTLTYGFVKALIGWRKAERYIKIINDNIRIQSALAEFNKALREETDAWRELAKRGINAKGN